MDEAHNKDKDNELRGSGRIEEGKVEGGNKRNNKKNEGGRRGGGGKEGRGRREGKGKRKGRGGGEEASADLREIVSVIPMVSSSARTVDTFELVGSPVMVDIVLEVTPLSKASVSLLDLLVCLYSFAILPSCWISPSVSR